MVTVRSPACAGIQVKVAVPFSIVAPVTAVGVPLLPVGTSIRPTEPVTSPGEKVTVMSYACPATAWLLSGIPVAVNLVTVRMFGGSVQVWSDTSQPLLKPVTDPAPKVHNMPADQWRVLSSVELAASQLVAVKEPLPKMKAGVTVTDEDVVS